MSASPRRESILSSFCPFRSFRTSEKNIIRKVTSCFFAGEQCSPLPYRIQIPPTDKRKNILFIPLAHRLRPRPPIFFQRACRQCVHESARLSRVICSHAWYSRDFGECKTADFCFILCRMHLPRMARATNSCTRKVFFKRGE